MIIESIEALLRLRRRGKLAIIIASDIFCAIVASYFAFFLRLEDWSVMGWPLLYFVTFSVAVSIPIMYYLGVYKSLIRFSGSHNALVIGQSVAAYMLLAIAVFGINHNYGVPRTVSILQPILFFIGIIFSRILAKFILQDLATKHNYEGPLRRVIIYGAGNAGQQLALSLRQEPGILIGCFVDDDIRLSGQRMNGVPIYHSDDISRLVERYNATDVFLAIPEMPREKRKTLVDNLIAFEIRIMTLPNLKQLMDGGISLGKLRAIDVKDLLGREPVKPIGHLMDVTITNKTVMVTGAGGSIGSELCRQILITQPKTLILVEMSEFALYRIETELREMAQTDPRLKNIQIIPEICNAADQKVVQRLFERCRPDTVYHAAAYKHVPLLEANCIAGVRNNIMATMATVIAAKSVNVGHYILVSTDKAVRPTSVMGTSKRICEMILQALSEERDCDTIFAMVRFGNVLGSSGSVVPRFEKQIEEGGPITLTHHDITRYFMTIPEAAQLVIQASGMSKGSEVYVLDMGEPVKIIDLARTMIRLSGKTERSDSNPDGDIEIWETGLRPGEKLYEELLIGNSPEPTDHQLIMRAQEDFIPWGTLAPLLNQIIDASENGDRNRVINLLFQMVPEYAQAKQREAEKERAKAS